MSLILPIDELTDDAREIINDELRIEMEDKYRFGSARWLIPYDLTGDNRIKIPFAFAARRLKIKRPNRSEFPSIGVEFEGDLRPEQIKVKQEAIATMNKKGSVILSMYCGFGKTITGINIACAIGFKTLIIVNKIVLMTQWEESINRFCPSASVQKVKPKCVKKDCDFYIINAINAEKMGEAFFADIGCVIVDEAHLIMAETVSKCLQSVSPRYLIGLTATPYRPDGLNGLLDFYFGEDKIIRELWREHLVYKVKTGFKPLVELTSNGRVNWGSILDSQSKDPDRNELIINIICHFKERNFLVLVKRVEQGEFLQQRLQEMGETVTSLIGSNQTFDATSRILVGTCSKVGTGFDHPKLDTLLMAADVAEYFIQYLGRCMRTRDSNPVVFDLVDDYSILAKHYATRKKIYEKHGGKICNFDLNTI
jgi:superfamily II DNA or RNA helicase